jgi:GNAT superfamily N-acetyltransferase
MTIDIVKLTSERIDEALQIYETVLGTNFRLDRQEILERSQAERGVFYVAIDADTQAVIGIKFGYIDGDTCVGRGIAVLPAYRRQGIATRLVRQFEEDLLAISSVKQYIFGSARVEGVPFHIAAGYEPHGLIQFGDRSLRERLDMSGFKISYEGYAEQYQTYQIFIALEAPQANLAYLQKLQDEFAETNVQFFFQREFER